MRKTALKTTQFRITPAHAGTSRAREEAECQRPNRPPYDPQAVTWSYPTNLQKIETMKETKKETASSQKLEKLDKKETEGDAVGGALQMLKTGADFLLSPR